MFINNTICDKGKKEAHWNNDTHIAFDTRYTIRLSKCLVSSAKCLVQNKLK